MAADTELQFIGRFHRGVESTPENDAQYKEYDGAAYGRAQDDTTRHHARFLKLEVRHFFRPKYKERLKTIKKAGMEGFHARLVLPSWSAPVDQVT